jgi:hypothetical protein
MNTRFRVWEGEEMHEPPHGFWVDGNGDLYERITKMRGLELYHVEHEVMQYTGLNDSEGTPIYEGDIIALEHIHAVVAWSDYEAAFIVQYQGDKQLSYFASYGSVVGNRHEDPELRRETDHNRYGY